MREADRELKRAGADSNLGAHRNVARTGALVHGREPAVPIAQVDVHGRLDRKSTRLNSSHQIISYAVFCLKKKKYEVINQLNNTYIDTPCVSMVLLLAM